MIFFAVSLLNLPILVTLWRHSFDDGTYSHAYLIPLISLYLFYILQKAGKLAFREQVSLVATTIFAFSCLALFVTSNAQISLGYWCSLLAVLISGINMIYKFNSYIIFPSAFFIFIMPVWGMFTTILQNISVKAVTFFMSFTNIPTFVENQLITIPAGVFEIAGGCSGLRYIIVSLAISSLFIFLYINNVKKALGFFSFAVLGALFTNWLRITLLILIGEYTNMESSLMEDHNTFGWYLFIPFMIILFWWGNKNADSDLTAPQKDVQLPSQNSHLGIIARPDKLTVGLFILLLSVSSTSFSTLLLPSPTANNLANDATIDIKPRIHFYSYVRQNIESKEGEVSLTYAFNGEELDGKPSYYENELLPLGWHKVQEQMNSQWRVMQITNRQRNAIILTRYEIDGQFIVQNRHLKLARLLKGIKNIKQTKLHWSFIPCHADCNDELQNL
ncbi:MAG: exosortase [Cognaticolwellia sp.]